MRYVMKLLVYACFLGGLFTTPEALAKKKMDEGAVQLRSDKGAVTKKKQKGYTKKHTRRAPKKKKVKKAEVVGAELPAAEQLELEQWP